MKEPDSVVRLAAYFADPCRSAEPSVEEVLAEAGLLIPYLQRQKIPLVGIPAGGSAAHNALTGSDLFSNALMTERRTLQRLREAFREVADLWAADGIGNLQIKSVGLPPAFPYRSDNLDVLVPLEHSPQAAKLLLDLGYVELKNVEEPHKFLFRKFHLGREVSAIHLHEFIGWGTSFLDEAQVWEYACTAKDDAIVLYPSPEDGLLITLAHAFYENKTVSLSDVQKFRHCLRQPNLDWDRLIRVSERKGWRDGLGACLLVWSHVERVLYGHSLVPASILQQADRWLSSGQRAQIGRLVAEQTFPFRVPFLFSKQFYYAKVWRDRTIGRGRKAWEALLHTTAGIRRNIGVDSHPAMLITLSGLDGCGKSAHARTLASAFEGCHIKNEVVWSRGGSSPLTDVALRVVRTSGRQAADSDESADDPARRVERRRAALRSPWFKHGWLALVGLDLLRQYATRVWWPLRNGRVVICDRYIYDALVEIAAYADDPKLTGGLLARLLVALAPTPHARYLLDVSPKMAALRSATPEVPAFLEQQRRFYHQGTARWGLQVVSNEDDFATVSDELVRTTLRHYYRDYWTLINAVFLFNPRREALARRQELLRAQKRAANLVKS